jgi:hypothetical protein
MIFMSQSGLIDSGRKAEWDLWYLEHLRVMITVPGIHSAQRFETDHPDWPPSLAMYTVVSAAVFDDKYYRQVRGMGPWLPLIDRRFYRRTLFDGLQMAPAVGLDSALVVTDQTQHQAALHRIPFLWLNAVGLDQATPCRGISIVPCASAQALARRGDLVVYRPATPRYTPEALRN